ncbi:hypothetical protein [Herminiimonas contaminans]|uniref:Uncharacterized protein n=1 Tax=Herminiimonas contaminans TaxID=1111140 RepID=A0ABS0EX09_9BURK|nr:hypothetical protein [Herminiimonas contaminans]MBF8177688.1 hypothetical protein [Herminiimonas contaminans]
MTKLNKSNVQHVAGMIVGLVNRFTGRRYSKAERGTHWFSQVAANLVADREPVEFLPFAA